MSANTKNMSTKSTAAVDSINKFFVNFIIDAKLAKLEIDVLSMWEDRGEEFKNLIASIFKTTRTKKSKDAPKNAKSGYMFFCQEMRGTVKEENPNLSAKEITATLGAMWKNIKETDEVEKYNEMTLLDKERYKEEMTNYVPSEVSDEKQEKKKRTKKPKDAPKNAKSGYMFFYQEMRPSVKESNPTLSSKEIITKLGAMWKEIKESDEAEKYNQMALSDKDRYTEEMSNYVPSEDSQDSQDDEKYEKGENGEKGKKKRAKKAKDAPKNAKSAYMFFCQEMRASVKEANQELSGKDITVKLGAMWKEIKETPDVEKYNQMTVTDKDRYKEDMENYVPSEASSEEEQKKKKRSKKSIDGPKNAKSAYLLFCQEMRSTIKEENPELSAKDIIMKLGAMWKEIKETPEVEKYNQMAVTDKDRYKQDMENYEGDSKKTGSKKTEKVSNEDIVREIIENCKSDIVTMKLIKDELKKKGFEIPKDELKEIISKINEDE